MSAGKAGAQLMLRTEKVSSMTLRHHSEESFRGQALVEFALVLVVLLLLAFGVMDLARIFHSTIVITNATREGTRYGTRYPDEINQMCIIARDEAEDAGLDLELAQIAVSCTDGIAITRSCTGAVTNTCDSGLPLRVTVSHEFNLVSGIMFSGGPVTITRFSEMMVP